MVLWLPSPPLLASGGTRLHCVFAYGSDTSGTDVATPFSTPGRNNIPLHLSAEPRLAAETKCQSSAKVFLRGTHAQYISRIRITKLTICSGCVAPDVECIYT